MQPYFVKHDKPEQLISDNSPQYVNKGNLQRNMCLNIFISLKIYPIS